MALVVEDGTGLANAESLIGVAEADAYFADRAGVGWAVLGIADKEAALRRATDYMGAVFGPLWISERSTGTQALDWPRCGYSPMVPTFVRRACAELALRAASGPLLADEGPQVEREQVGPVSVTYAHGARHQTRFAMVWAMLGPYLRDQLEVRRA